ncbi:MAG: hypothetical protein Q4B51_03780 [Coriobacteriaceae bacterium]|nr:hypothetical protein [Coriobacteriaceae bacterium]
MSEQLSEVHIIEDDQLKAEAERKALTQKIAKWVIIALVAVAAIAIAYVILDVLWLIGIFLFLGLPAIILVNLFFR